MPVQVRPFQVDDVPWAERLYAAHSRDALSAEERRTHGFVQGRMSEALLRSRVESPASVVAEADGDRLGVVLTFRPEELTQGPPSAAVQAAQAAGLTAFFLYGPALVAPEARGRGVLRAMAARVLADAGAEFDHAVAFVDDENPASLAAHTRLGWDRAGRFVHDGRGFMVLSHRTLPAR